MLIFVRVVRAFGGLDGFPPDIRLEPRPKTRRIIRK